MEKQVAYNGKTTILGKTRVWSFFYQQNEENTYKTAQCLSEKIKIFDIRWLWPGSWSLTEIQDVTQYAIDRIDRLITPEFDIVFLNWCRMR